MKSRANGPSIRSLRVMMPTCVRVAEISTGSFLINARFSCNFSIEAGTTAKKRPVAASLIFMLVVST